MSPSNPKNQTFRKQDFKISFVLNEEFKQFKSRAKAGQVFQARIINRIDNRHYLLLLNKQKIIAEFAENLPVGQLIYVKVSGIARRISLQYLGMADDAFQNFKAAFSIKPGLSAEEWHILFTKWVQYNLPLDENTIKIYRQFQQHIRKLNNSLMPMIPELWLLAKRWKLNPTADNITRIAGLFIYDQTAFNPLDGLLTLFYPQKNEQNSESIISSLLFEKKLHKLKKDVVEKLHKIFSSNSFAVSSREEIMSLIFKKKGFLLFLDKLQHLRAGWIREIAIANDQSRYHLIFFAILNGKSTTLEINLDTNLIRITAYLSDSSLQDHIKIQFNELQRQLQKSIASQVLLTTKNVEFPEFFMFSRLNEHHVQLKRII